MAIANPSKTTVLSAAANLRQRVKRLCIVAREFQSVQEHASKADTSYSACGNNLHKTCFDQWAASKRGNGATVTCPFCRTPWQASDISELAKYVTGTASATGPKVNADGYVNIAQELGISGKRDYSSVSSVRFRQRQ